MGTDGWYMFKGKIQTTRTNVSMNTVAAVFILSTFSSFFVRINSLDNDIALKAGRGLHSRMNMVVILNVAKVTPRLLRWYAGTYLELLWKYVKVKSRSQFLQKAPS